MYYLKPKRRQLKNKFQRKNGRKNHIEHIQYFTVFCWLVVVLHSQCDRVDHDENKYCVFKRLRSDKPPNFVLNAMLGDISVKRN